MAGKRPISVPRNFDDQAASFASRIKSEGWDKKHGIDLKTLDADVKAQREGKQKDEELAQAAKKFHNAFLVEQADRYQRFMTALEIVRAANRTRPEVLKTLSSFKRPTGTPRPKKPPVTP